MDGRMDGITADKDDDDDEFVVQQLLQQVHDKSK